jgi:hypothetical protein
VLSSHSQSRLEQDYLNFKNVFKRNYTNEMQFYLGNRYNIDSLNFEIYPVAYYVTATENDSIFSIDNFEINTSQCFAGLTDNCNNIIAMFQLRGTSISQLEKNKFLNDELKMIEYAQKYDRQPFYVILDDEYYRNMAFFKDGKLCFIDDKMNFFGSFKDLILKRYGCMDKYWEIKRKKKIDSEKISAMDISVAKETVRKDYSNWYVYFPQDTLKIVESFLNEMETIIQLKENQRNLIKEKIYNCIKKDDAMPYNGIYIYGKDVSLLLFTILTEEQYFTYLRGYSTIDYSTADKCLEHYYIDEKHLSLDEYTKFLKNEILLQK